MKTSLSPRQAQIINLRREGLSNGEIAAKLGITRNTVALHIYRAMKKLARATREKPVSLEVLLLQIAEDENAKLKAENERLKHDARG